MPKLNAQLSFKIDLQSDSLFTVLHHFRIPNLEIKFCCLKDAQIFANFDKFYGNWQLMLALPSQECQSLIMLDGIFTPTSVIPGTTNVDIQLQSSLMGINTAHLLVSTLFWLDDILLCASAMQRLLESILSFFASCTENNIEQHPAKSILFAKEDRWCGQLTSADGIRYSPRGLDGWFSWSRLSMKHTCNSSYAYCIRLSRPNPTSLSWELVASLDDLLKVYDRVDKRTQRNVSRALPTSIRWA